MFSKHLQVGPGGVKCSCCFPRRGSKSRRRAFRQAKRRDDRSAMKFEIMNMVSSNQNEEY